MTMKATHEKTAIALALGAMVFTLATTAQAQAVRTDAADSGTNRGFTAYSMASLGWPSHTLEWYYNPNGAPTGALGTEQVIAATQYAAQRWMDVCNVKIVYKGLTTKAPTLDHDAFDGTNVIGWRSLPTEYKNKNGIIFRSTNGTTLLETDMSIAPDLASALTFGNLEAFTGSMTRGIGFMLGLFGSDNPQAVMSNSTQFDDPNYYRSILRANDVAECVVRYGASTQSDVNRVLNWGDAVMAQGGIGPSGQVTVHNYGFNYRYYSTGNTYVGEQNGTFYTLFPNSDLTAVGTLNDLLPQAISAGY